MNQWLINEWIPGWVSEWINQWQMNKWITDCLNESMTNKWINTWLSVWMNQSVTNEWKNNWLTVWTAAWPTDCLNGWLFEWYRMTDRVTDNWLSEWPTDKPYAMKDETSNYANLRLKCQDYCIVHRFLTPCRLVCKCRRFDSTWCTNLLGTAFRRLG